jgi:rfaE bifunctional protein nucleotidyltransferase chain/domain
MSGEKRVSNRSSVNQILDNVSNFPHRYQPDFKSLIQLVSDLRKKNKKIVLTQGVYDLIHEGHARYLEMAKSYGDVLIVGVDSDELTRKRKGDNRPVVPEDERIEMLVHLRHVDIVVKREAHHDIGDLIKAVKPDVLVTSFSTKDFTEQMAKEYGAYCKQIITLEPQGENSTTARIRKLTIEGAEGLATEINKLTKEFVDKIRNA